MPPTSDLEPVGRFFEEQCKAAWEHFYAQEFDKANAIAQELLAEPALAILHRASMHFMLAHSPDEYVLVISRSRMHLRSLTESIASTRRARSTSIEISTPAVPGRRMRRRRSPSKLCCALLKPPFAKPPFAKPRRKLSSIPTPIT